MTRILVIGAGLIGIRHTKTVLNHSDCELVGIVEPDVDKCAEFNVPCFASIEDVNVAVDGAIIATPTSLHFKHSAQAAERGWHILIEKPVAETLDDADKITEVTNKHGVRTLVGHHRRYHKSIQQIKSAIQSGEIGQPVLANLLWAVRKPDDYFQNNWRAQDGSPVMINLVHDIDILRFIFGEITEFQSMASNAIRNQNRIESGVIGLRFESGLMATIAFSDTCPSPWGFEAGTGENPNIATTNQDMMWLMGTKGSLSFPSMTKWSGSSDWSQAPVNSVIGAPNTIPLVAQLEHFIDVIKGNAAPLITAADARGTLKTAQGIKNLLQKGLNS